MGKSQLSGTSSQDFLSGLFAVIGTLTALYNREKTGVGQKVDVAMLDCQVAILENAISRYEVNGVAPGPIGNRHPSITPFEAFKAKDGYVIIAVGNDRLWKKFCDLIYRPELIEDERFVSNAKRTENQKQLKAILDTIFPDKTVDEWLEAIDGAGIPCGPINTVDRVMKDPQVLAREMIVEVDHPVAGKFKMPGLPIKLSETPGAIEMPAPLLGQHTEELLHELLGLSKEDVAKLKEEGAL